MPSLNTENNFKFSKDDRVVIITRAYEDLKFKTGRIIFGKNSGLDLNTYKVEVYFPKKVDTIIFAEEELQFEDSSKERDWKLKQLLK